MVAGSSRAERGAVVRLLMLPQEIATQPLPRPLTSLIGRDDAVAAVEGILSKPGMRLCTLTGPGGIGKTRLSIQVASHMRNRFPDGIAVAVLAPLTDSTLVIPTIAEAVGVTGPGSQPIEERLVRAIDGRRLLLVVDNFEHVMGAAPQISALLRDTSEVVFLITSRSPLHIRGEHEYAVAPLALPPEAPPALELAGYSACALFVERIRTHSHAFVLDDSNAQAVLDICRLLGGVPLAIELAAARGKSLSVQSLLQQLRVDPELLSQGPIDQPPRHRTMRAAIQWSYDLLPGSQQALLRQLSVAAAGCSLDSIGAITGNPVSTELIDDLAGLIDASLLDVETGEQGETRYELRYLIRRFGLRQLEQSGELPDTVHRFATWLMLLANEGSLAFTGNVPGDWVGTMSQQMPNFRSGLTLLQQLGDTESVLRLTTALGPIWSALGYQQEGLRWLLAALEAANDQLPRILMLRARNLAMQLSMTAGEFTLAEALAAKTAVLAEQLDDDGMRADIACTLGNLERGLGRHQTAQTHYERALAIYRNRNDQYNIGYTLIQLAKLGDLGTPERPGNRADVAAAEATCREALDLYRFMGNRWGMARATNHLSYLLYKAGRFQEAATVAADALTLFAGSGNLSEGSQSIENLADMAGALRQGALAARLYGIAEGLQERLGTPMWPSYRIEYEQEVARVRSLLEPTELQTAWNEGKSLPKDRMVSEALAAANRLASMRAPVEQTDPAAYGLTSREIEVLQLLATGASNRVIAETLFISLATVKGHVQNIMRKLGLRSRTALATFALQHELVTSAQADRK